MREADARPSTFSAPPRASPGRGGNGLSLAAIDAGTARFDDPSLSGYYLETERVAQLSDKLLNLDHSALYNVTHWQRTGRYYWGGNAYSECLFRAVWTTGHNRFAARASLWTLGTHASRERCEHGLNVTIDLDFTQDLHKDPILVNDKGRAFHAHVLLAIHIFLFPHVISLNGLTFRIGQ